MIRDLREEKLARRVTDASRRVDAAKAKHREALRALRKYRREKAKVLKVLAGSTA